MARESYAKFYLAKYYCGNCDTTSYIEEWGQAYEGDGILRCDCSDYEDGEE